MIRCLTAFLVLFAGFPGPASGQAVTDDFSDGDFTHNPPWTGDAGRFVVVPFGGGNALRSDGLALSDTVSLSTASTVASGYWTFRFVHTVNLSNVNGARVYLVASSRHLAGDVHGYYVQFGTNNLNRVELWRQDGPPASRVRLGESAAIVAGDANSVTVEVMRDDQGRWRVLVDGELMIAGVSDATYTESAALGVWVKHNATGRDRFFFTDFLADPDPGDLAPPHPIAASSAASGALLFVQFDEPLEPTSVTPDAFAVSHDVGSPASADALDIPGLVRLAFDPPIPAGAFGLHVQGVADLAGNVQPGATVSFVVAEDDVPPDLIAAEAVSESVVRVTFSEPVIGCDAALYEILPGIGAPAGIGCGAADVFDLLLDTPLAPQTVYTVVASGVADLTGNVQPATSASFFFGTFDVPGPRDIVINEVMYAPAGVSSNEFVELLNRTESHVFDLKDLRFANATSPARVIAEASTPLAPGEYVVLVRNVEAFEASFPGVSYVAVAQFPALLNSGDRPQIARADGEVIDAVPYLPAWGGLGVSLERLDPAASSTHAANWASSMHPAGGTPGAQNSAFHPDVYPPTPLAAEPANDGLSMTVPFDEPLDPASVVTSGFSFASGPEVASAAYFEDGFRVVLTLAPALEPAEYTLLVTGVRDLVGNEATDSVSFAFAPDLTPPHVVEARALTALSVEIRFDEAVGAETAGSPEHYWLSDGAGHPAGVVLDPSSPERVRLALAAPLEGPRIYHLTVRDVADIFGNVMDEQTVSFFYGEPEAPAGGDVVINEIMYAPVDVASNEYVELFNVSTKVIDLAGMTLSDQGPPVPIAASTHLLAPGAFVVLARNGAAFEAAFPGVPHLRVPGFPTLLNGGDAVVLRQPGPAGAAVIDSVFYRPAWGGQAVALERRSPGGPSFSPANWASSLHPAGGTPGGPNSVAPDTFAPEPVLVEVAPVGDALSVYFNEPLDAATVDVQAFAITGVGVPLAAVYGGDEGFVVDLTLQGALPAGSHTLTIDGVSDLLGNATANATIGFAFAPDTTPPGVAGVFAVDASRVRVRFDEPVRGGSAAQVTNYWISEGIGTPADALFDPAGDQRQVDLVLASPLDEGVLYQMTAEGVVDLAGNVMPAATAFFVLGQTDTPLPGDVLINEVMFREADGGSEYVELFNASGGAFDLSKFTLSTSGSTRVLSTDPLVLPPGAYLAVARSAAAIRSRFGDSTPVLEVSNLPALRNTGDAVVIRRQGVVVDSVYYLPRWHRPELRDDRGVALERLDPHLDSNDPGNWTSSLDPAGGTPGRPNSAVLPAGQSPDRPGLSISPSPFDALTGTVIRYRLAADAASVRIRVFDAGGRAVRTLEEARLAGSALEGQVIWNGRDDAGRALRMGVYIVLLEALDLAAGRTENHRAAVVLARSL
jgi:hypothetical protein